MSIRNMMLAAAAVEFNYGAGWSGKSIVRAANEDIFNESVLGVFHGNGRYVAWGSFKKQVAVSTNLTSWSFNDFSPSNSVIDFDLFESIPVYSGVYFAGRYIISVGSGNHPILSSADGVSWLAGNSGVDFSSTYGTSSPVINTDHSAFATNGTILLYMLPNGKYFTTADGQNWTLQTGLPSSFSSASPIKCVWTGSEFFAVGDNGSQLVFAVSTNGVIWTEKTTLTAYNLRGVGGINNFAVISAYDAASGGTDELYYTDDGGDTWTTVTPSFGSQITIGLDVFNGNLWGVNASTRIDTIATMGQSWGLGINISDDALFEGYPYNNIVNDGMSSLSIANGKIIAGGLYGTLFEIQESPIEAITAYPALGGYDNYYLQNDVNAVADDGTTVVIAGAYGRVATIPIADIYNDNISATFRAASLTTSSNWGTTDAINCITWTGSLFVLAGANGKAATSPDGITWTYRTGLAATSWGTAAAYAAVSESGDAHFFGAQGHHAYTSDGVTWVYDGNLALTAWGTATVNGVVHDGSKFVVVGDSGNVATSTDGTTWVHSTGLSSTSWGTTNANEIIWVSALSLFVVVGDDGKIATSPDASTWTVRTSNVSNHLNSVGYGADKLFAAGDHATVTTSDDGITWTDRSTALSNVNNWESNIHALVCCFYNTRMVLFGGTGRMATSP